MQNNLRPLPLKLDLRLAIDDNTRTALMQAVERGNLEQVTEILASNNHNINAKNADGKTALDLAYDHYIMNRHHSHDILKVLLVHPDIELFSALRTATSSGNIYYLATDIIKARIKAENVNNADQRGMTPLMYAVKAGDIGAFNYLLELGADVMARNKSNRTVLDFASKINIVKSLLMHPANDLLKALSMASYFRAQSKDGPNESYATKLFEELVKARINAENVNNANQYGMTPLMYAAQAGNIAALNYLLGLGADVNAKNKNNDKAFYFATKDNDDIRMALLKHPATDLLEALRAASFEAEFQYGPDKSYAKLFEELVRTRANNQILSQDAYSEALNLAVNVGSRDSVSILLDHKADPNKQYYTSTAVYYSTLELAIINFGYNSQRNEILDILLEHQSIDLNQYLREAIQRYAGPEVIKKLLTHPKVDVTTKDANGKSALDYAYKSGHGIDQLLNNPYICVNAHLRLAIMHANVSSVEKLLKNPYINFKDVDADAKTILDLAKQINPDHPYAKGTKEILGMVKKAAKSRHGVVSYYFNEVLEVCQKLKQAISGAADYCYKAIEAAASMILQPFKNMMGYTAKPVESVAPKVQSGPAYQVAQAPVVQEGYHVQRHEARAAARHNIGASV